MTERDTEDPIVYRYADDGRFRFGVPRRDLTARDASRLGPALLRDVTGGEDPIYRAVEGKAATAARKDAEKAARADAVARAEAGAAEAPATPAEEAR